MIMGKKLYGNKKILIGLIALLLIIVGIVVAVLLNKDSADSEKDKPVIGTEQNNNEEGLQIQEDNGEVTEDSSDASGSWEDGPTDETSENNATDNSTSEGNETIQDSYGNQGEDEGGNEGGDETGSEAGNETENDANGEEEEEKDEDTLIDDKIWGNIF